MRSFSYDKKNIEISEKLPNDIRNIIYNYAFEIENSQKIESCNFVSSKEIINIPSDWMTKPIICCGEKIKVIYQYHDKVTIFEYPNKYNTYQDYKFISTDTDHILMLNNKNQYVRDNMIIKPHIDSKLLYVFDAPENVKYYVYEIAIYANHKKIYPSTYAPEIAAIRIIYLAKYNNNILHISGSNRNETMFAYTSMTVDINGYCDVYAVGYLHSLKCNYYSMLGHNIFNIVENKLKIQYSHSSISKEIPISIYCESFTIYLDMLYTIHNNILNKYKLQFTPIEYKNSKPPENLTLIVTKLIISCITIWIIYIILG